MTAPRLVPDHRPRMDERQVRATIVDAIVSDPMIGGDSALLADCPVRLLGVRGYFRDSVGRKGANDLGYYDDAIALVTPDTILTFNANVDPVAAGWNAGVDKYYAQLEPGVWPLRQGPHRGRPNHLRQLTDEEAELAFLHRYFDDERRWGEFKVRRITADGVGQTEWGCQNINVHEGTARGTASWGCQTIVPEQWSEFAREVYAAMNAHGQRWGRGFYGIIPYILTTKRLK